MQQTNLVMLQLVIDHFPKYDFTWYHVEEGAAGEFVNETITGMWCAKCRHTNIEH